MAQHNNLGQCLSLTYAATQYFQFSVDFMGRGFSIILFLLLALPAAAQIYKYTDAEGNTAYSNQPPQGVPAQTVELPPLNSIERQPPASPNTPTAPVAKEESRNAYEVLELTDIPTEEALRANNGTFTVGVRAQPRLQSPHLFRLLLDGQPYGQSTNVPRLQLVNIDRGEHSLAVQVIDGEHLVQQSETVTFTVQRVHQP
ncbi:hypothetical protein J2W43_004879 [Pseudomonas brassicacearum]|uniref:DUF4124 domain-containing protein n=2 Tax=Pseudomonas TaxID=286 RepID=A0AAW8MGN0_9PSED|nr:hypothetical protein [Pseudomonas brassicacearum]